ncbi:MAG: hypothetical protein EP330_11465 [Deltaproteobacteria bacterium]|nr:MAG: hypothetical protein EP330_11465 [Deltaproteobacteria bacterium]
MRHTLLLVALVGCVTAASENQPPTSDVSAAPAAKVYKKTVYSDPYHIDDRYMSMRGPWGQQQVDLLDSGEPELLWITAYETHVVDLDGKRISQEWMCHANLDIDAGEYQEVFDTNLPISGRLFTLSQGQQRIEFPEGWGLPIVNGQELTLTTQVLNLNIDDPDKKVKHEVTIEFKRDKELTSPMKPMFQGAVQGFKALGDARYYGVKPEDDPDGDHGPGCEVGAPAVDGDVDYDRYGQEFSAHWKVTPGPETNTTLVTEFLGLPYDTKAHYIAVHLHPFAESLRLIDRTTGETVYYAEVENSSDRIGLDRVEYLHSEEGIQLYKGHDYELVSRYNNTSDKDADSMAVMYMYMDELNFEKPDLKKAAAIFEAREAPVKPEDAAM